MWADFEFRPIPANVWPIRASLLWLFCWIHPACQSQVSKMPHLFGCLVLLSEPLYSQLCDLTRSTFKTIFSLLCGGILEIKGVTICRLLLFQRLTFSRTEEAVTLLLLSKSVCVCVCACMCVYQFNHDYYVQVPGSPPRDRYSSIERRAGVLKSGW